VTNSAGVNVPVSGFTLDPGAALAVNTVYNIGITFVARVADDRKNGLYLSTYTEGGITK
jgi:hypothetical protein